MSIGFSNNADTLSLPAAADYSAKQFYAMKVSSGKATICGVKGELALGILINDADAAGRAASVQISGVAPAVAGTGGVTNGDKITTDADGRLITTTTSDHYVLGIAIETAAEGERFSMKLDTFTVP